MGGSSFIHGEITLDPKIKPLTTEVENFFIKNIMNFIGNVWDVGIFCINNIYTITWDPKIKLLFIEVENFFVKIK